MLTLPDAIELLDECVEAHNPEAIPPDVRAAISFVVLTAEIARLRGEQPRQPTITNAVELTEPQRQILTDLGVHPRMEQLPDVTDVSTLNAQLVGTNGDTISESHQAVMTKDEALVHAAYLALLADDGHGRFAAIYHRIANT